MGSGIASYSVFFADNGGAFMPLLTDTTQTTTSFAGQVGHTYRFYSVATDNVGYVQAIPTAPQATTTVSLPQPPALVTLKRVKVVTNQNHQVTEVLVIFSGAVKTAEAVRIGTYRLATAGKLGSYTAKDASVIKLKSAVYSGSTITVRLTPLRPFIISKPVQLVVYGTGHTALHDSLSRLIDGDHNAKAGGNAIAILSQKSVAVDVVPLVQTTGKPPAHPAAVDLLVPSTKRTLMEDHVAFAAHLQGLNLAKPRHQDYDVSVV
jgi:hypothetical protein